MAITQLRGVTQIMDGTVSIEKLQSSFIADNTTWTINTNNLATITGIQDPVNPYDAANKGYVDSVAAGLKPTDPVLLLENGTNLPLSGNPTIDGVATFDGNRVLLNAQTNAVENGVWEVFNAGWTRPTDFPTGGECAGIFVFVETGATYADEGWVCTTDPPNDIIDTNPQSWAKVSKAAQINAGDGMVQNGQDFDVVAGDTSLNVLADSMNVAIGTNNGNSLETTATGVELRTTVTGNRTFDNGDFTVSAGAGNDVSITGTAVDVTATANVSISGVDVSVSATGSTTISSSTGTFIESSAGNITFADVEVASATNNTAIPFAIRPTSDYGNGNGTAAGDAIDQFRSDFTDDAVINALLELRADIDNGTSKLTNYYGEAPAVTNGSPTVTLTNLGSHASDKVTQVRVYLNGARQNEGASNDFTVNQTTGVITFTFNLTDNIFGADVVVADYASQDA